MRALAYTVADHSGDRRTAGPRLGFSAVGAGAGTRARHEITVPWFQDRSGVEERHTEGKPEAELSPDQR